MTIKSYEALSLGPFFLFPFVEVSWTIFLIMLNIQLATLNEQFCLSIASLNVLRITTSILADARYFFTLKWD